MKRCKDCKWCFGRYKNIIVCVLDGTYNAITECKQMQYKHYHRKWWKFWRQK